MANTKIQYTKLDDAFKFFNDKLWEGKLPDVLITLQRKSRTFGYHHHEKFSEREGKLRITEIALNPDGFVERSDAEILSTLVHEMAHLWQYSFSEPARRGYHDKEWAREMKRIGLYPSNTGEMGGKETGQRMSHYIIENGLFDDACKMFLLKEKAIIAESAVEPSVEKEKKKTRWKYTCPVCLQNVWAKKDANIMCGDDRESMIVEED